MNLEITEQLVNKLNNAAKHWNSYIHVDHVNVDVTERYFDSWCKETCGLDVTISEHSTSLGARWMTWDTANVTDEEKYIWFLLSF